MMSSYSFLAALLIYCWINLSMSKKTLLNTSNYRSLLTGFETGAIGMAVDFFEAILAGVRTIEVIATIRKTQQIIPLVQ